MCKKIISISLFIAIVLTSLTFTSCGQYESKNPDRPDSIPIDGTSESDLYSDSFDQIAENDNLILYFNSMTTDIRVKNKKTGYIWTSEQYDSSTGDYYRGQIFTLDYSTKAGAVETKSSSTDSIERGQFEAKITDTGVSVTYGVGDVDYGIHYPLSLSPERYDEIYNKMDWDGQMAMEDNYEMFDFTDPTTTEALSAEELSLKKQSYPKAVDGPYYYMTGGTKYKNVTALNKAFHAIGYTQEEFDSDNKGEEIKELSAAEFSVTIEYKLTDTSLSVSIPDDKLYYDEDYTLQTLDVLPYMMDFDNSYDGYYLLPDGSGSIMNFNNNKENKRDASVYVQMYGVDNSRVIDEKASYYNDAIFPVFGTCVKGEKTKKNGGNFKEANYNGIFGIITSGETFAGISANTYDADAMKNNNLSLEFRVNERVKMDALGESSDSDNKYYKYQFQRYLGNMNFNLYFLSGEESTYSGMANFYSEYLFGSDSQTSKSTDYYSTVETVGLINTTKLFFGIEYNAKQALTSFSDVEKIAKDLKSNGFNNMNIKLSGWCNGGYEHGWLNNLKVSSDLGGEDALTSTVNNLKGEGINVYPDIDFQNVYTSESSVSKSDCAASLNGGLSIVSTYSPVDFTNESKLAKYVLTMNSMIKNLDGFMSDYTDLGIKNISYRGIGTEINSNFRDDEEFCERQETLSSLVKEVKKYADEGYSIMGNGGQAAFIKYLDVINKMPIESAHYDKCDYSVPFTSMVLSGHVDYTYQPINLSNNNRKDLLQLIEADAGAYYTLTNDYYEDISYTSYDNLYSTVYNDIKDQVYDTYNYLSTALKGVYGCSITKHEQVTDNVYATTYANGTVIYVNYGKTDYKINKNNTVKAEDYCKIIGGAE